MVLLLLCVHIYIYTFLRETTRGGGFSGAAPPRCGVGKPNRSLSGIARVRNGFFFFFLPPSAADERRTRPGKIGNCFRAPVDVIKI